MENIDQRRIPKTTRFKINPNNLPLRRPGVYLLRNTVNGKCYVGMSINVKRRLSYHSCGHGRSPVISIAIRKYGVGMFEAIPLYYSLSVNDDALLQAEASLIASWDCMRYGYNVMASSSVGGPRGKGHSDAVRAAFLRPEVKAKIKAYWASEKGKAQRKRMTEFKGTPEGRAINSAGQIIRFANPEARAKASASAIERMKNPDLRARISATSIAVKSNPEWVAKHRVIMKEITNRPEVKKRISESRIRMMSDPKERKRLSIAHAGRIWITDGSRIRCVWPNEPLQQGWRRGRKLND